MQPTPYIWMDGQLVPWEEAKIHVLTHALHYGSGVYEGVRFYETPKGPAIFRLPEHTKRLFRSAEALQMEIPFSETELNQAVVAVVARSNEKSGYIRPLAFYGYGKMGLNPVGAPVNVVVACWGWGKYLPDRPLRTKISSYMRLHPKSIKADAKVCGHYVNSIMASLEVHNDEYDEAILLDYEGNVAEGPGENIFLVQNGKLFTPPTKNIIAGITRDSVFKIAQDLNISTEEKAIIPEELLEADELFFTGTAAEVSPIGFVNGEKIGNGEEGPLTKKIRELYLQAVRGELPEYENWLTYV